MGIALDQAVGNCNGTVEGRRYFSCDPKVTAAGLVTKTQYCKESDPTAVVYDVAAGLTTFTGSNLFNDSSDDFYFRE